MAAIPPAPIPAVPSARDASAHVVNPHVRPPSTAHPAHNAEIAIVKKAKLRRTALIMTYLALQRKVKTRRTLMASTRRADTCHGTPFRSSPRFAVRRDLLAP